jgi:hypothetical protein
MRQYYLVEQGTLSRLEKHVFFFRPAEFVQRDACNRRFHPFTSVLIDALQEFQERTNERRERRNAIEEPLHGTDGLLKVGPMTGGSILTMPSRRRWSNRMPSAETCRPHTRMYFEKRTHFVGCSLRLNLTQTSKKALIDGMRPVGVSLCVRMSSSQYN